jgi:dolichyl-phosphate beta-glucosyltransferase
MREDSVRQGSATPARTLVIPMFRESARIAGTIRALAGAPLNRADTEFILVDDGSDDDTIAVAEAALATSGLAATILRLQPNRGKGAAVRAGVLAASGQVIAFSDADLSASVDEIERCFAIVESGRADVVFTSRAAPNSRVTVRQSLGRELSGKSFNLVLRALGLTRWRDTQCGLKGFTRDVARQLFARLSIAGFAFDAELLLLADRRGLRIEELPIEWRHVEESRVRPVRDGLAMLRDALRLRLWPPG